VHTIASAGRAFDAPDEKQLVLAFQEGKKGAYDAIHASYEKRVESVCRRMLGNPDDAREATQETFLRVYQALPRFNGRYQLGAWVSRIATNVCLDHLRARSRRPGDNAPLELVDADLAETPEREPEAISIRNAEGRRVRNVLASLPPMHRAAIVLRDFEGLSYEEVAAALGVTDAQVKALIHRARQRFKRSWTSVALALVPVRWAERVRGWDGGRDQTFQVLSPMAQAASSCSAALQQCGQYVSERVAVAVTAVVVGTTAVASGGAAARVADGPPATSKVSSPSLVATLTAGSSDEDVADPESPERKRERSAPDAVVPETAPTEPAPATTPGPATTPAPEPSPEADDPQPKPSPDASPSPTAEPQAFTTAIGFDRGGAIPASEPWKHQTAFSCATRSLEQRLDATISDGSASHPVYLYVDAGTTATVEMIVWKQGRTVYYSGRSEDITSTQEGDVLSLKIKGTYAADGDDAAAAALPTAGEFDLLLHYDCDAAAAASQQVTFTTS